MKRLWYSCMSIVMAVSCTSCSMLEDIADSSEEDSAEFTQLEKDIASSLYTACRTYQLSDYDIEIPSVKIINLTDIYMTNTEGNTVALCGIEIQYLIQGETEIQDNAFLLILSDGLYCGYETKAGLVDYQSDSFDKIKEILGYYPQLGVAEEKSTATVNINKINQYFAAYEPPKNSDETAANGGWHQAYCNVLTEYQEKLPSSYMFRKYYLPDINKDGIPELVIYQGENILDAQNVVYTFQNGAVMGCGASDGRISIDNNDEEKIRRVSEGSDNIISVDEKGTYVSFCYNGYQRTAYLSMTEDYTLEISDYYDSGKEKLTEYKIPGTKLESCDISSTALLDKAISQ